MCVIFICFPFAMSEIQYYSDIIVFLPCQHVVPSNTWFLVFLFRGNNAVYQVDKYHNAESQKVRLCLYVSYFLKTKIEAKQFDIYFILCRVIKQNITNLNSYIVHSYLYFTHVISKKNSNM